MLGDLDYVGKGAFSNCIMLNSFDYKGTNAPRYDTGSDVFYNCLKLENITVPKNYNGNDFCGKAIVGKKTSFFESLKEWFNKNVAWVAPIFTIISGTVAALGFIINYNKKVNVFCITHCCCCCRRKHETTDG